MISYRIFINKFGYFPKLFKNKNKIEIHVIFFISAFYKIAIATRQAHERFIKLPFTLLFWHDVL